MEFKYILRVDFFLNIYNVMYNLLWSDTQSSKVNYFS